MDKPSKAADMTYDEIVIALRRRGRYLPAAIARELKVTKNAVYGVMGGRIVSHRIRLAIAEKAGIDIARIWPSTYLYGGGPKKYGRPRKKH